MCVIAWSTSYPVRTPSLSRSQCSKSYFLSSEMICWFSNRTETTDDDWRARGIASILIWPYLGARAVVQWRPRFFSKSAISYQLNIGRPDKTNERQLRLTQAIYHNFLWFISWWTTRDVGRTREEFVNHEPQCCFNIPSSLSAYKPKKLVVYCFYIINSENAQFFHEFTGTINHSWLTNQSVRIDLVII